MIKIIKRAENGQIIELKFLRNAILPNGEIDIALEDFNLPYFYSKTPYQTIVAKIENSDDIIKLMHVVYVLTRMNDVPIRLFLLEIPYIDREFPQDGEAFGLGIFINIINLLNFQRVSVINPNSMVKALLHRLKIEENEPDYK